MPPAMPAGRMPSMHSTCLFCHRDLGRNEAIEVFQLGRRLAFDAERGRLWVVCPHCRGWNLTPLDERWEAIEQCERAFRDTRLRVATDQIGLARLREGLELVRIGRPERPEFAAWRYGERITLRRRRTMIQVAVGLGVAGAVVAGGVVAGVGIGGAGWWVAQGIDRIIQGSPDKVIARIADASGRTLIVRRKHLRHLQLSGEDQDWQLRVPGRIALESGKRRGPKETLALQGDAALREAGHLLPALNRFGGSRSTIADAVHLLETRPDPAAFYHSIAADTRAALKVAALPPATRLALEMAAHEETERRALEGELVELEAAWREAEEIAGIADNLFLPSAITEWIDRARGRSG